MKSKFQILNLIFSLWLVMDISDVDAQTATNTHVLIFVSDQQRAEGFVNGFPLHIAAGTNTQTTRVLATSYLIRGTNEFRLLTRDVLSNVVANASTAESIRLEFYSDEVRGGTNVLQLDRTARPLGTNGLEEVITFTNGPTFQVTLSANLTDARTEVFIDSDNHEAKVRTIPSLGTNLLTLFVTLNEPVLSSLPWTGLSSAISSQDIVEIRQAVALLHAAFTNRNPDMVTNLLRLKIQRVAASKGLTFSEEASARHAFFTRLFAQPVSAVGSLDPNQLVLRAYPPANLVQVFLDGQPPILLTGDGFRYRLPVFFSKLQGTWQIVE